MNDDEYRISEFKKALRQYSEEGVVDLDKNYPFKFNFQIHRYEDVLLNSRMSAPPNRWSFHRLCFLKQGEGELISGIYKFKATKNTFFVIPSRVISSSKNWSSDTKGYVLLFNVDFFLQNNFTHQFIANKKLLSSSIKPYVNLNEEQAEEITRIFESLLTEKKRKENIKILLILFCLFSPTHNRDTNKKQKQTKTKQKNQKKKQEKKQENKNKQTRKKKR